jgi:ADP-heptose:LPS heptosyltransferase
MKVLVVRFSSIGDIVLTSPVVRCLAAQLGAEIHFLTKAAFAQIPAAHPSVRRVWALGKGQNAREKVFFYEKMPDLLRFLKKEKFDHVIDLHHNLRSWRVKFALRCPATVFDKLNLEKWLLVRTGIDFLPNKHIVHRYMEAAAPLGVRYDGLGLDFHYPPDSLDALDAQLEAILPAPNTPFIAFVIGAAHATKRLPREKIVEICQKQLLPVLLLGGPDEMAAGQRIAAEVGGGRVINACGALSLFGSARAVERAEVVISHDTGLMHIAAAFRKRIFSVWGSTVPRFGMAPFYPDGMDLNTSVEVQGLGCRPCSKIGFDTCPKGHFKCMRSVELGVVAGM